MNEYQDQALWWVTEYYHDGMWQIFSDHDTKEDANEWAEQYRIAHPHQEWRVRRESGLNAWES